MPTMTLKVCTFPGCGVLVGKGDRLCSAHRPIDRRGSRGYSTTAWQAARAKQLREHPTCQGNLPVVGWTGRTLVPGCTEPATEVDHVDGLGPRGPRGTDPTNLRSYCKHHHSQRTGRDHHPGSRQERGVA